jgi:hypothetical protein
LEIDGLAPRTTGTVFSIFAELQNLQNYRNGPSERRSFFGFFGNLFGLATTKVFYDERSKGAHRATAASLQHHPTAQFTRLQATGTTDNQTNGHQTTAIRQWPSENGTLQVRKLTKRG